MDFEDCEGISRWVDRNVCEGGLSGRMIARIVKGDREKGGSGGSIMKGTPQVVLAPYLLYQCEGVQREGIDPDEFPNVDVLIRIRVMAGCCLGQPILQ